MKNPATLPARVLWNAFFWTYERATWQYDLGHRDPRLCLAHPSGLVA